MIKLQRLDEASIVTFNGRTYPNSGWAVVLAGGAGSGKGFIQNSNIAIDAKVIDVDKLKSWYVGAINRNDTKLGKKASRKDYRLSNADDVSTLHQIVKQGGESPSEDDIGWDDKYRDNIIKSTQGYNELPNLLFDITGKSSNSLIEPAKKCKELGYKTSYVWVVTNREEAMIRNASRQRRVGDSIFHSIHNSVNSTQIKFLTSEGGKWFDEAWIIFASNDHAGGTQGEKDWRLDNMAFKLKKTGNSFQIDDSLLNRLTRTLGPNEPNPKNPEVYSKQSDVVDYLNQSGYKRYSDVRDYGRNFRQK